MHAPSRPWLVKVGGSVLAAPQLPERLSEHLPIGQRVMLLAGGGPAADWVRLLAATDGWADSPAHWAALASLRYSAALLASRLHLPVVQTMASAYEGWAVGGCWLVLDPLPLLARWPAAVPANWDTTSDTLAAYFAHLADSERLVLAKHVGPRWQAACSDTFLTHAATAGWLDAHFAPFRRTLHVSWLNAVLP